MLSTAEAGVAVDDEFTEELYEALVKKDEVTVIELCKRLDDHALHIITMHKDTVLHTAAYTRQPQLLLRLLGALPLQKRDKITRQNEDGNTILHEAVALDQANSVKVVKKMLEKAPELLHMTNNLGETALFLAARSGKTKLFNFLVDKVSAPEEATHIQRTKKTTILHAAVRARYFGLALEIAERFSCIKEERDKDGMTALQLLSCDPLAFENVRTRQILQKKSISEFNRHSCLAKKCKSQPSLKLAVLLTEHTSLSSMTVTRPSIHNSSQVRSSLNGVNREEQGDRTEDPTSSISQRQEEKAKATALFLATKSGCNAVALLILQRYPLSAKHIDDEGKTIFHVAIKYRRSEVFKLLLTTGVGMRWLSARLDNDGNSILHMNGMKVERRVPGGLGGPVLALQEELLWFEHVKSIIKPDLIDHLNKNNQTADALFADSIKDLPKVATEWLRTAAQGCSVVAVLIATVAFAAAYTVPGGPNQNNGSPIFINRPFFVVFITADALSVSFALASVVMYLSILTSSFQLEDFKQSLPNMMMLGFTFMFLSVLFMMIAFAATIILMARNSEKFTKGFLYFLSFLPVSIFSLSWLPLYASLARPYKNLPRMIKRAIVVSLPFVGIWFCLVKFGLIGLGLVVLAGVLLLIKYTRDRLEKDDYDSAAASGPQNPATSV